MPAKTLTQHAKEKLAQRLAGPPAEYANIPVRFYGGELAVVEEISKLCGYNADTVASVLFAAAWRRMNMQGPKKETTVKQRKPKPKQSTVKPAKREREAVARERQRKASKRK